MNAGSGGNAQPEAHFAENLAFAVYAESASSSTLGPLAGGLAAGNEGIPNQSDRKGLSVLKLGIVAGDDIGPEVVPEAVKVMKAAAARSRSLALAAACSSCIISLAD